MTTSAMWLRSAVAAVAVTLVAACGSTRPVTSPPLSTSPSASTSPAQPATATTATTTPSSPKPTLTRTPSPQRSTAPAIHTRSATPWPRPTQTATATRKPTPTPTRTTPPPVSGSDNRVYVIGDSVLLGTTRTLPAALAGWRVTMDCVGSRRLPQAIQVLKANRSRIGSVVVIQMGNNYIAGEDGSFASQIDQAMRVLRGVRRVVWVTVAERWPSRVEINKAIRAAASRWSTIRVADWAPMVASHPADADDMLHLSPSGRLAISRLIAQVVGPAP